MSEKSDSVVLFARKTLENNTRIFKQADTLREKGYDVTIIGIRPDHLPAEEQRAGYDIVRVGKITPDFGRIRNVAKEILTLSPVRTTLKRLFARVRRLYQFVASVDRRRIRESLTWLSWPAAVVRHVPRVAAGGIYRLLRLASVRWSSEHSILRFRIRLQARVSVPNVPSSVYNGQLWKSIKDSFDRFRERVPVPQIFRTSDEKRLRRSQKRSKRLANRLLNETLRRFLNHGRWFVMSYNYYTEGYRAMAERDLKPDVVHANDLNSLIVSIVAAYRHGAPLIYDAQELYTEIHTLPRWYKYLLMAQEFFLIRFADRVTVVNPFIAEVMEQRYGQEIDEVVLNCPPLATPEEDSQTGPTVSEKFDIDPNVPVVLYSGGLSTQRGLENLIEAMNDVPEAVLVILGEGALRPELESLTESFDLNDRVYFSDFVPHEDVPAFISSADIGVIPYQQVGMNHYLSSPSKLFHYIMAELVIAGSDFSFLKHTIEENDIGETFDPDDPESMAAAINAITEDEDRLERHRENVIQAKYRYTWENEAEKFLAQYEEMHG